jgi:hypothetical protein
MALMAGNPSEAGGGDIFKNPLGAGDYLTLSRPGAEHLSVAVGKIFTGSGYRYTSKDIRYHGRVETGISAKLHAADDVEPFHLTDYAKQLLMRLRDACASRGVKVVYSMPWTYTSADAIEKCREKNASLINEIHPIIPTISDGADGAMSDIALFSDTGVHLSESGSKLRSERVSIALEEWLRKQGIKTKQVPAER